ncbi:TVG0051618 [Thermoplasma volcanium GSS1]|uniref:A-type ATP synthase subunit C n=1 Tax=Thermoplasma volcanium (strain ATCC 51530 / DSM 4299 / JCM 9571 / NBRC 15438 / GSS1) TaxID=273116 RepID=AATC_THEVO|nr:V-type ATP synthase subunit C [Thermoplasma volcanium]Q97CQ2.1 RecName: Full=V-type ATP synthase subunit C; AltName: Full=V-ATPase subunit C [Thermoplasma volcanium GSS1]BAB59191.1 TVG0051618 [Thermoplasma volcanium GSS1]
MDATYVGAYGRLKVYEVDFLKKDFLEHLISLDKPSDFSSVLYASVYKEDYDALTSIYREPDLTEMAINRHLVRMNRIAAFAIPPLAKNALTAYISKWDIENIKTVISSKFLGHGLKETEMFIVSFRDIPMGLIGGVLTNEDYRNMMNLPNVEAIINYLTRYGYGSYMLQFIEDYRKTGDISPMLYSLDRYYYARLLESLKYYNGDEGPVINYIRSDIDRINLNTILKGKKLNISYERFFSGLVDGGNIPINAIHDFYGNSDILSMIDSIKRYYDLEDAKNKYASDGNLYHFDVSMRNIMITKYMGTMSMLPLSLDSIFYFIIRAEIERQNLRTIYEAKLHGAPKESIYDLMINGVV